MIENLPQNGDAGTRNGIRTVRFGAFEADLHAGEVRKEGSRIKLQEQPFKVLQILLENPGNVVSREELQSRIWPDDSYGDFDHAVNVAVGKLRMALGDSAESPCFIETVPRRGYRFVATLEGAVAQAHPAGAPPVEAPPAGGGGSAGKSGPRRTLLVGGAVLACVGLVAAGILLGRRTAPLKQPEIQRLTVERGTVYSARFAPDGRNVLFAASWDGAPVEIFAADLSFPGSRSLGLTGADLLSISSSGEMAVLQPATPRFMLAMTGTMGQVPLAGGAPRQIAEGVDWADWAPDGSRLAMVRDVGGSQRLEYPQGNVLFETSGWISHPRISPDGTRIAFLDHPTYDDDDGNVAVVDLSGHVTMLSTGWESASGLAWAPDGHEVWFSATSTGLQRQIYAVDLAGHRRLGFRAPGGVTLQDIAPDGRVLMTSDELRSGIMGSAAGATRERDLSWRDWSLPADISRDGKMLLFDEQGEQSGPNYTVAIRDLEGSAPIPLGEGMAGDLSPDGKWAAATVNYKQIVLLPTGAGNLKRIDTDGIQRYEHGVHWLPDGKQIVFTGELTGHLARCFIQNVDGGPPRPVTPEGVTFCQVSPDGKMLAAGDVDGRDAKIYPMNGGEPRPIPGLLPHEGFEWTADPNFLYVFAPKDVPIRIYRLNIQTGQRQLFKEITLPDMPGLCGMPHILFSADGRSYVYGYTRLLSQLYLVKGLL